MYTFVHILYTYEIGYIHTYIYLCMSTCICTCTYTHEISHILYIHSTYIHVYLYYTLIHVHVYFLSYNDICIYMYPARYKHCEYPRWPSQP